MKNLHKSPDTGAPAALSTGHRHYLRHYHFHRLLVILPDLPFNGIFIPLGILCVTPDHRFFHLQQSLQDHECFTLNDFGS